MKLLCYVTAIALLTFEAQAGYILPELGRSKMSPNTAAIAVGFSERNTVIGTFAHSTSESITGGVSELESKANVGGVSLYLTTSALRFETIAFIGSGDVSSPNTVSTDSHSDSYSINGNIAMPFGDFVAGLGLATSKDSTTIGGIKSENKYLNISPAFGFRIAPQMAIGAGLQYDKFKSRVGPNGDPDLDLLTYFTGFAYGIDRKIGEDGFGIEGIITHRGKKESEMENGVLISTGATTEFIINGDYTISVLDLGFSTKYSNGKNYKETSTTKTMSFEVNPEISFLKNFYVTPGLEYEITKNTTNDGVDNKFETKVWAYGLILGVRSVVDDFALAYSHGKNTTTPGDTKEESDTFSAIYAYHF